MNLDINTFPYFSLIVYGKLAFKHWEWWNIGDPTLIMVFKHREWRKLSDSTLIMAFKHREWRKLSLNSYHGLQTSRMTKIQWLNSYHGLQTSWMTNIEPQLLSLPSNIENDEILVTQLLSKNMNIFSKLIFCNIGTGWYQTCWIVVVILVSGLHLS